MTSKKTYNDIDVDGNINTNQIILNRNQTLPAFKTGTIFYDEPNQTASVMIGSGVTLQLGQEIITLVYATENILNGEIVYNNGSFNGLPSVGLAISSIDVKSVVLGVTTEDIPSGSTGFITSKGLIRDLNITGVNIGDIIYLSDTTLGAYTNNITLYTSRINKIGIVLSTGITTGIIYADVSNENILLSLSDFEKNILSGNNSSTGCYEFTGITKTSDTTFTIAPLKGWILNNTYLNAVKPIASHVIYTGQTNLTTPYLNTAPATYILINSGGTISMQTTYPTAYQRRVNIFIGRICHPDRTTIFNINNTVDFDISPMNVLRDMFTPMKLINEGIIITPNGNNLNFNTTSGKIYGLGINFVVDQLSPDTLFISANTPSNFFYRTQTGGTSNQVTVLNPSVYDLNGVITTIPSAGDGGQNRTTNQRVYLYSTGGIVVQYGQKVYDTLALALAGQQSESFVKSPIISDNAILIGLIAVRRTTTNLSDSTQAVFVPSSMFGENIGGVNGISTTSLQQAYNNSVIPQIITNPILDGVVIQQGSGNDTDKVFGISNGAGVETFKVIGNGGLYISGNTLFTVPFLSGYTGNNNEILVGTSLTTAPTWKTLSDAGIAPSTGSTIYLPYQSVVDAKGQTGFINGNNIDVFYNSTNNTVTLTGDLSYQWRGETKTLTSPWTSSAHTATISSWYLYSTDGINFIWSTTHWDFENMMVAYVYYGNTEKFGIRETHGLMDYNTHSELHSQIGTYRESGGLLTIGTYTANTATDDATTPLFDIAVVKDEDSLTTIPAWTSSAYTRMYISTGNTSVFNVTGSTPFYGTTNAYIQVNNATTGAMSLGVGVKYYNVYQILMPTTSDPTSQLFRIIMLQPQATFTSLALAQAEDVRTLKLGSLSTLSPEYVIYARITYITSAADTNIGKCRIATNGVSYITGNKVSQVSVVAGLVNNHATLTNLSWLNSNHDGTPNTFASFDASGNTSLTLLPYQLTNIVLASSGWTLVGGFYEYSYSNTGITSSTSVDVIPANASISIINAAQILPRTLSSTGNVILYSTNAPTGDINVDMTFSVII